jgi:hypothetical protein
MSKINSKSEYTLPGSTKSEKSKSAKKTSPIPITSRLLNPITQSVTYKNGKYEGKMKDGKRHGVGKMTYNCSTSVSKSSITYPQDYIYEGDWKDDKRNGNGKMTYYNKGDTSPWIEYYEGDWKDDKRNGHGTMHYYQDENCTGYVEFENNKLIKGDITYVNGNKYKGELDNDGVRYGKGTMKYKNGDEFTGEWNYYRDNGTLTYANGDVYTGKFYDGKKKQGKMTYANGDIYDGEWVNDKRHGKGKLIKNGKVVFDGEWINDKEQTMSLKAKKKLSSIYQTARNRIFGSRYTTTKKKRDVSPFFKSYDITW